MARTNAQRQADYRRRRLQDPRIAIRHPQAEKTWRRVNGIDRMAELMKGIAFKDGIPAPDNPPERQKVAA